MLHFLFRVRCTLPPDPLITAIVFLTSLPLALRFTLCYHSNHTIAYTFPRAHTLSPDIAQRRAARRKVIERAQHLERESYKAMMRRKRRLQTSNDLATIV